MVPSQQAMYMVGVHMYTVDRLKKNHIKTRVLSINLIFQDKGSFGHFNIDNWPGIYYSVAHC